MSKIKLGCIGIGAIFTSVHLPVLLGCDEVEIVAVCDIIPTRMNNDKLPKNVKKYETYQQLIADKSIDAVDICTPNYLHSIIAIDALKANKHVFCEKPDAINVSEMQKMIDAEKSSGKTLMVMRNNRHLETSKYLKNYINNGNMGDIYAGRCGWIRRRGIPGKGGWFTTTELSGGGPLIDLGVHIIDLSIYLMGNPKAVSVSGSTYTKFAESTSVDSIHAQFGDAVENGIFDVEDLAMGFIKFDNGSCLQIEFSWASNIEEEQRFIELRGTKAGLHYKNDKFKLFSEDNGVLFDNQPTTTFAEEGHKNNLLHFVDVIKNGATSNYTSAQGLNMIKIISAIYQSAKTGKEVSL